MIELSTIDPHAKGRLTFCLIGRVVSAAIIRCDIIRLTYDDGRTADIGCDNYGDTLAVTFDFPGTRHDAPSTEFEEPSSADR